ncbi:MAG: N-6 DNA methylase [Candidatus Woesearchaeota archaeon]|nr:N-6 DNA methylase [Candidatus Woesearchaeota archaeon]
MTTNMFCDKSTLKNESDVEQFFTIRLLQKLGYEDKNIKTKKSLSELVVSKGSHKENYKPDYVCFCERKPKIVVDAKHPDEIIDNFTYQVSGYALALNKQFRGENPVRFTILMNGGTFKLYKWDEEESILNMKFEDFSPDNVKYKKLYELISFENIKEQTGKNEIALATFFSKPTVEEVKNAFNKCHQIIWKKEKISPTDAFYEFSKIIFVKLNEDKRIRAIIDAGREPKRNDFKFSMDWLEERETETENPLSSILFAELQKILQEQIEKNKKKPIFTPNEGIDLHTETIAEVVKVLQNYDLYSIDEDLNGRMFETFLNATIRGRELGQYFTPRKAVKFMTKLANLRIRRVNGEIEIDSVMDACCGSGGFLIDAMADLLDKVQDNPALKPYKKEALEAIQTEAIFGIEANPKISRIARMNMYVHGDGGSRIYCSDSLDKEITIRSGTKPELKREIEELKNIIVTKNRKFKVVLSNPPFSMSYRKKEKGEKAILEQYGSTNEKENLTFEAGTQKLKASVKSNVLFIARYADLLEEGGKLLIVLDNSVLNTFSHKEYRDFIRRNYLIKAVFQLPTHMFVNQEAGGITSILYLEKRKSEQQEQPCVFARVIDNVGHNVSGKEESTDDFDIVLKEYERYEREGKLFLGGEKPIREYENDHLFLISPERLTDRIDVFFHQPSYNRLLKTLNERERKGTCILKKLADYSRIQIPVTSEDDVEDDREYKYIEISAIDKERGFIVPDGWEMGTRKELAARAKLPIRENDVLFSKPFRSLKKVVIIPKELDNQLASNGFYGIRPQDYAEASLLWAIFRSDIIQKQFFHLCSGYTQRELNDEYLKENLIIPIPKDKDKITKAIMLNIEKAKHARAQEIEAITQILEAPKIIFK